MCVCVCVAISYMCCVCATMCGAITVCKVIVLVPMMGCTPFVSTSGWCVNVVGVVGVVASVVCVNGGVGVFGVDVCWCWLLCCCDER